MSSTREAAMGIMDSLMLWIFFKNNQRALAREYLEKQGAIDRLKDALNRATTREKVAQLNTELNRLRKERSRLEVSLKAEQCSARQLKMLKS